MLAPWKKNYDQPWQLIKKQRHYFANKGPSSQSYCFSSSHVWIWELDYKESWAPKNWCFWTVVLEKTLKSPLDCREIQPVHSKGNQSWILIGRTDAEAETPILWLPDAESQFIRKDPDAGKNWRWEQKGMTADEMAGWHHQLNGHEFEWAPGVGDGQRKLVCCSQNWKIIALQNFVAFCQTSKWISHRYTYIPCEPSSHLSPHPTPLGWYRALFEFPETYRKFPLAIYFTHGNVSSHVTLSIQLTLNQKFLMIVLIPTPCWFTKDVCISYNLLQLLACMYVPIGITTFPFQEIFLSDPSPLTLTFGWSTGQWNETLKIPLLANREHPGLWCIDSNVLL